MTFKIQLGISIAALLSGALVNAAEHEHTQHAAASAPAGIATMVSTAPASGKARESGYDGNDMMESTAVENALEVQCAQASRGLIMLDRATLARCSGHVAAPPATTPPAEHQHH